MLRTLLLSALLGASALAQAADISLLNVSNDQTRELYQDFNVAVANVKLITIDEVFGGWQKARNAQFERGGSFDPICKPAGR